MSELFHLSQGRLAEGSVILPGNWGRMIKRYRLGGFGNAWVLARELIFEEVRARTFPSAPCRLNASYVFIGVDPVDRYRASNDPNILQVLHRVEIVDTSLPAHIGPLAALQMPTEEAFLDTTRLKAIEYWRGSDQGDREMITASAIRVLECLG